MYMKKNKLAVIDSEGMSRILVFGDIHGDYAALSAGLKMVSESDLVLFLGDYADRGPQGVEVIQKIDECISELPEQYIAVKGNHEDYLDSGTPAFSPCTLIQEVQQKGESWDDFFPQFTFFVEKLYLSALLPGYGLFVHGGISTRIRSVDDLQYPERETEETLLWSDPGDNEGEERNPRGAGYLFGPDVTTEVLSGLRVSRLFRSHQPRKASGGPAVEHSGRVVTLNSTSVYGGRPFILVLPVDSLPETDEEMKNASVFL